MLRASFMDIATEVMRNVPDSFRDINKVPIDEDETVGEYCKALLQKPTEIEQLRVDEHIAQPRNERHQVAVEELRRSSLGLEQLDTMQLSDHLDVRYATSDRMALTKPQLRAGLDDDEQFTMAFERRPIQAVSDVPRTDDSRVRAQLPRNTAPRKASL
ncbi:hypothetical protein AC579_10113 [Pseudocercospora musae]|uniref:Uncharacterized protein n=1 Tax=Pseudocercospora musae TaxID=113226 RepID=A0A139GT63_9PEZI|nr:hypothetical protein AC579_10113 [Pseudocercospora musae]